VTLWPLNSVSNWATVYSAALRWSTYERSQLNGVGGWELIFRNRVNVLLTWKFYSLSKITLVEVSRNPWLFRSNLTSLRFGVPTTTRRGRLSSLTHAVSHTAIAIRITPLCGRSSRHPDLSNVESAIPANSQRLLAEKDPLESSCHKKH